MKVTANIQNDKIWGVQLEAQDKLEKEFLRRTVAEGGLRISSETSGAAVTLALPSMANLRLVTLSNQERRDLSYLLGMGDVLGGILRLRSFKEAVRTDPPEVRE